MIRLSRSFYGLASALLGRAPRHYRRPPARPRCGRAGHVSANFDCSTTRARTTGLVLTSRTATSSGQRDFLAGSLRGTVLAYRHLGGWSRASRSDATYTMATGSTRLRDGLEARSRRGRPGSLGRTTTTLPVSAAETPAASRIATPGGAFVYAPLERLGQTDLGRTSIANGHRDAASPSRRSRTRDRVGRAVRRRPADLQGRAPHGRITASVRHRSTARLRSPGSSRSSSRRAEPRRSLPLRPRVSRTKDADAGRLPIFRTPGCPLTANAPPNRRRPDPARASDTRRRGSSGRGHSHGDGRARRRPAAWARAQDAARALDSTTWPRRVSPRAHRALRAWLARAARGI